MLKCRLFLAKIDVFACKTTITLPKEQNIYHIIIYNYNKIKW